MPKTLEEIAERNFKTLKRQREAWEESVGNLQDRIQAAVEQKKLIEEEARKRMADIDILVLELNQKTREAFQEQLKITKEIDTLVKE